MGDTIVSIHQPNFLPWLKLLDKILASDVYVAYDTVLYTKSEYHARQKVKSHAGPVWLSVPVRHVRGQQQVIEEVVIDNGQPFRSRHLRRIKLSYGSTPYFGEVFPILEDVYGRGQERLVDLNVDLIGALCSYLDAQVRIVRASSVPHDGDRTQRLIDLVTNLGGTEHLTSTFGTDGPPVDWHRFTAAGIPVSSQHFEHPEYEQVGDDFIPGLAAIDMLFMYGRKVGEVLASRRRNVRVDPASGAEPGR
ncbi:hypothetical protein EF847_08070 [Actinobacteria bacterium YIM 96077]|uniref:WbqC family protein n=1 Tax=Phytoactinopolyspora halophila TaxID=1981511 RepID=A0A329QJC9_9ACTN|nr:WbqC family protein [Phytoactinopolyspora halophila]AYY12675.1 hypothetical protein EF847_08070 [Actinobacteria bacterium YIM 96077]RAW10588.1 hypothetical protein DPM12_18775 [Phytoactinopolyspora halophila]